MKKLAKAPRLHAAQNKYGAVKTRGYDSAHEAERARELHLLERAGKIHDLREQVRFELVPAMWTTDSIPFFPAWYLDPPKPYDIRKRVLEGEQPLIPHIAERQNREAFKAKKAKIVERKVEYRADFVYFDAEDNLVVEDAKGVRTPDYIIKRKLMLWLYGIKIREV